MNKAVDILADDNQVFIFVCTTKVPGELMMAVNIANGQQLPSYCTLAKLSAVQRDSIVVVGRRTVSKRCGFSEKEFLV